MTNHSIIHQILCDIATPLADFLETYLPKIDNDGTWWTYRVVNSIPSFALQKAEENNLHTLDTASLLKIFDSNWDGLKSQVRLDIIIRNYLKETQTIRNTWAHPPADAHIPDDVIDRHLDTLYRLCEGINANQEILNEIASARTELRDESYSISNVQNNLILSVDNEKLEKIKTETISVGTLIRLKAKPEQMAPVMKVSLTGKEPRYTVFINGKQQNWYQSQIDVFETDNENETVSLDDFNAYLTATQLKNPNTQALFSLNSAKIEIIPHQFRPVLKFIKSDRPRLLIADSVGVGKTIEAGLILKELEARNDIESVLIICPKPLVSEQKWEDEMKFKFGENFTSLGSKEFRQAIRDASMDQWDISKYGKVIIPYSLLTEDKLWKCKNNPGLLELENPPKFDLVIVDEAHHIRNSSTLAYKAVKYFIDNADAAILLTATPIQMGEKDLFTLLNLIRPDLIPDSKTFEQMSAPNPFINAAVEEIRGQRKDWKKRAMEYLITASNTLWGKAIYTHNPLYIDAMKNLKKDNLTNEERVTLLTDIEYLHSFSFLINRTRRRDIDSKYASRKPSTIETPFSKEEAEIYNEVLRIQKNILEIIQPDTPAAFMMSTLQRRAASSLHGLVPFLEQILKRNLSNDEFIEAEIYENEDIDLTGIKEDIISIIEKAKLLPENDNKYNNLCKILEEKKKQEPNKVMVFSSFRHTLSYLSDKLLNDGYRIGVVHGGVKDEDRQYLRDRFKLPNKDADALDILLFSEVGCEGLDYQFCDCMVNYDLPWNPMKIEQRIGRIDRTGQKSETISIFNLITPDTVDATIFHRCLSRIGIFNEAIGGNEEILGDITSEIKSICENFTLSEREKNERLSQLEDNEIRKYLESQKLEEEQAELFGVPLSSLQLSKDLKNATSFWLSPECLENIIKTYFKKRFKTDGDYILGLNKSKKLRLSAENRSILKKDFNNLQPRPEYSRWKHWLDGKDKEKSPYYPVYFDSQAAVDGIGDLITPTHPLIRQAVGYLNWSDNISTSITVIDNKISEGNYPFAIYLWDYSGLLKNQKLIPVALDKEIANNIFDYLKYGTYNQNLPTIDSIDIDKLEEIQYELWMKERDIHKQKNNETLNYKTESLKHSYQSRTAVIQHAIDTSNNPNILRMKNDEMKNVLADEENRLNELGQLEKTADVQSSILGYGIVEVKHDTKN